MQTPTPDHEQYTVTMANGDTHHVTPLNPDQVRWEMTAAKRWPEMLPDADAGGRVRVTGIMLQQTFICWAALKRTKVLNMDFETFRDEECLEIVETEADDMDETIGDGSDPTQPEPTGYVSPTS